MKLYPDSKVYICCPGNIQTGGPELCHQLASQLISFGVSVFMVYGTNSTIPFNPDDPVHDAYKKYHVPYATSVEDDSKNIAILPEAFILQGAKKIRRVIWWMSVDNYLKTILRNFQLLLNSPLANPVPNLFFFHNADKNIEHWLSRSTPDNFLNLTACPVTKFIWSVIIQICFSFAAPHTSTSARRKISSPSIPGKVLKSLGNLSASRPISTGDRLKT